MVDLTIRFLPKDIAFDNFELFMLDFNLFRRSDQGNNFMVIIKRLLFVQNSVHVNF